MKPLTEINYPLINQQNQEVFFSDFLGEYLVLYFYPKDFTPGCTDQACSYQKAISLFDKNKIKLFGISADSPSSHKKFKERYQLEYDLLSDKKLRLAKDLEAVHMSRLFAKRKTYIYDPQHQLIEIIEDVDPEQDPNQVLEIVERHRRRTND